MNFDRKYKSKHLYIIIEKVTLQICFLHVYKFDLYKELAKLGKHCANDPYTFEMYSLKTLNNLTRQYKITFSVPKDVPLVWLFVLYTSFKIGEMQSGKKNKTKPNKITKTKRNPINKHLSMFRLEET